MAQPMQTEDPDEHVRRFLAPDETAFQFLARTYVEPLCTGLPLIDRFVTFRGGQVLEIASGAGAGRTTCLLQVAAACILPEAAGGVGYGGKGAHVLFFDLDAKLDVVRLLEILDARIFAAQQAAGVPQPDVMPVLEESLPRFHLVRCHSSFELLAALRTLGPTLSELAAAPGGLACLLLDNVAAYYYLDRAARGAPSSGATSSGLYGPPDFTREGAPLALYRVHAALAAELRAIQRRWRLPIIATKHLVLPGGREADKQGDGWAHRDPMMKPWQDLVTHRLLLRVDDSGGGGVARRGPTAATAGVAAASVRVAKWQTPEEPTVVRFELTAAGVELR